MHCVGPIKMTYGGPFYGPRRQQVLRLWPVDKKVGNVLSDAGS